MFSFRKILFPNRQSYVNFTNPLNGRQWLRLLQPDADYGITFIPNLNLPGKVLGFTFLSNRLGLRGPQALNGRGVVLGTSFGMGMSVDNGLNWYDLLLDPDEWFNASMPVGPSNHAKVLEDYYSGPGEVLLYLYHPNLWRTAQVYAAATAGNQTIFNQLGWKTGLLGAMRLYPRWVIKEVVKSFSGHAVYRRWNGRDFHFNALYSQYDSVSGRGFALAQMTELNRIFQKFDRVIAIRTPIKEDSLPAVDATPRLLALRQNYDDMWCLFRENAAEHVTCFQMDHAQFTDQYFHPFDTHWSAAGNALFARMSESILVAEGVSGLRKVVL